MCVSFWLQSVKCISRVNSCESSVGINAALIISINSRGGCAHINVIHVVSILLMNSGASDINCIKYVIFRLYWNTGPNSTALHE
jgi:hypothetical protein